MSVEKKMVEKVERKIMSSSMSLLLDRALATIISFLYLCDTPESTTDEFEKRVGQSRDGGTWI